MLSKALEWCVCLICVNVYIGTQKCFQKATTEMSCKFLYNSCCFYFGYCICVLFIRFHPILTLDIKMKGGGRHTFMRHMYATKVFVHHYQHKNQKSKSYFPN
jgi:hypothetical protein